MFLEGRVLQRHTRISFPSMCPMFLIITWSEINTILVQGAFFFFKAPITMISMLHSDKQINCDSGLRATWVILDKSLNFSDGESLKTVCGSNIPGLVPGTSLSPWW